MICTLEGQVLKKTDSYLVLVVQGVGYQVFAPAHNLLKFPSPGGSLRVWCHQHFTEANGFTLYGFESEPELAFFELLITVSGVGPRSALAILEVAPQQELAAAIQENRPDSLARAAGVGRKTAERIILELRNKVTAAESAETIARMGTDTDLVEALAGLGYRREDAKSALGRVDQSLVNLEDRLRAALKILNPPR
ncbi:MAG: Holliday junction branch migration protein RuvA [Candidatus Liptonbacteria bacterium]|nr:Holliday junction branch migration protein RuvA [Candidatus Liptonbacteria bacterium]